MKILPAIFVSTLALCFNGQEANTLKAMLASETQFSDLCLEKGIRHAFLEYLAEDAIVLQPDPLPGRDWYTSAPDMGIQLEWYPVHATISNSGELGYTTGPWISSRITAPGDTVHYYGEFVTVWQLQNDGRWLVLIDGGNSHTKPDIQPEMLVLPSSSGYQPPDVENDSISVNEQVSTAEESLATSIDQLGYAQGFRAHTATDIRILRENSPPILEHQIYEKESEEGFWTWEPLSQHGSGDLGFALGYGEFRESAETKYASKKISFLRIWKNTEMGWKIVLDLQNPVLSANPDD